MSASPCACALVVEKMQAAERGPVRKRVLLRFFALFCSCYVLGVVFLHYSASTANGRDEVATVTKLPAVCGYVVILPQGSGLDALKNTGGRRQDMVDKNVEVPSRLLVVCKTGLVETRCGVLSSHSSLHSQNSSSITTIVS